MRVHVAVPITLLLLSQSAARAQCRYQLTVVDAPDCPIFGSPGTIGSAINESGAIVGEHARCGIEHWPDSQAFFWSPEGGLIDLPVLPGMIESRALDINDGGRITGWIDFESDGMFDVGFVSDGDDLDIIYPPSGSFIHPRAINNDGDVVGTTSDSTPYYKAFIWDDGALSLIEPKFGPRSSAYDVHDGQVVGWMGNSTDSSHAFLWQEGRLLDLGIVPEGFSAVAFALSDQGHVVGSGLFAKNVARAFLWEGGLMQRLDPLPGFESSEALDVNSRGQVVGDCFNFSGRDGFIWQHGVMTNLNDLQDDPSTHIGITQGINDLGQITGYGSRIGQGTIAFILTPIPRTHDLDGDCLIGLFDLEILIADWGPCLACTADLDADGAVGIVDLLVLLANWG